ncbi:hypothetical protein PHYBLDRAFT_152771 [Phycomyces blakesleeanus NRRL 1555(-)]|uniref:Uncharacterized protein n=1 Tax=Phycomyces blakesleeanus (strain ATCC 8743b / DSM 1359 / FGSC 10004 / NBRC 33097 / NRRL 1555) TaxID=763407 RepID=A0A162T4E9_PHYB8|nr:hypothetical protein PHYBLDRAFT_152771 [Phycomyces blakesleeanus NRRL 1555(-)]OAD66202.1 hypothetical protein PHYBLDRAFT_152771 [Phycomyces blakesleeanus NRRL 1555(-)]|eukprot:XP_018284242.1 hypothetical protein PHYBLDRAFT_152771 [Phycomyces blakesleeanus NRRL 1555(-)]
MTRFNAGQVSLIPRIKLNPSESNSEIEFQRFQFPVYFAFAMTINKSQGQTLESIRLYPSATVFSHGQLYVTLSRVRKPSTIKIVLNTSANFNEIANTVFADNVVFKKVFDIK